MDKKILKEAWEEWRKGVSGALISTVFVNLLMLASPIYMTNVYDRILASSSIDTLIWLTLIIMICYASLGLFDMTRMFFVSRSALNFETKLDQKSIDSDIENIRSGKSRSAETISFLEKFTAWLGSQKIVIFMDAPFAPFFLVIMFYIHPLFGWYGLVSTLIVLALAAFNHIYLSSSQKSLASLQGKARYPLTEYIRTIDAALAMGFGPVFSRLREESRVELTKAKLQNQDRSSLLGGITKSVRMFLQSGVLGLGAWLVISGELTGGVMIAGSILLGRALQPAEQAIQGWTSFLKARGDYQRLVKNLDLAGGEKAVNEGLPEISGKITVSGVTWSPDKAPEPVLKNISFDVEPGECVILLGESGSGKSSLMRLLAGIEKPSLGFVKIDNAPHALYGEEFLGKQMGYLPQDVLLGDGPVAKIISRFQDEVSPELVVKAATESSAHELIMQMPQGYETRIGTNGIRPSGGQSQRIGLARAFFGDPVIIMVDEPDAHLDEKAKELLIESLIKRKEAGVTIIIATHDKSLLRIANKVVFLEKGEVKRYANVSTASSTEEGAG